MIYVAGKEDTLDSISRRTGVPGDRIRKDNGLGETGQLTQGQALWIAENRKNNHLAISGCADPSVCDSILEQAVPALKELLVFSYGFTFQGKLIAPENEGEILKKMSAVPLSLIMVLVPYACGAFHHQLVRALSENRQIQEMLIQRLVRIMNLSGL